MEPSKLTNNGYIKQVLAQSTDLDRQWIEPTLNDFVADEAARTSLEELEKAFNQVGSLPKKLISNVDKDNCLKQIAKIAAYKIRGKRSWFLKQAAKGDQPKNRRNFHFSTLEENYLEIICPFNFKPEFPIWEISNPKTNTKGYLCGTMHCHHRSYKLPEKVKKIAESCDYLGVELDITNPEVVKAITEITKNLMRFQNPNEFFLVQNLDSVRLNKAMEERNKAHPLRPFINININNPASNINEAFGIDRKIIAIVKNNNKEIISLETPQIITEMGIDSFKMSKEATEKKFFTVTSSGFLAAEEEILTVMDLWTAFNKEDSKNNREFESLFSVEFNKKFIINRNFIHADAIDKKLSEQSKGFFAIGLAHCVSTNNVIDNLIERGYTISPIDIT